MEPFPLLAQLDCEVQSHARPKAVSHLKKNASLPCLLGQPSVNGTVED